MVSPVVWQGRRWSVVVPTRPLTAGHVAIVDGEPEDHLLNSAAAYEWLSTYRRVRAGLWARFGYRGFMIAFSAWWTPALGCVGEPEPLDGAVRTVHVFGRGAQDDPGSPVRAMASPAHQRVPITYGADHVEALTEGLAHAAEIKIPGPSREACDGCRPEVLRDQERWRADGVLVIRPQSPVVDQQALVLPLRHVVSLGDLDPDELVSVWCRLAELRGQFAQTSGSTGLSCFANDGVAARQETPHAHLHVFGRSVTEQINPFRALAGHRA